MLPSKLKLGAHDYVVRKQKEPPFFENGKRVQVRGTFCSNSKEIIIRSALSKQPVQEAETFLHEVLHGIAYTSGIFKDIEDSEEDVVNYMARGLITVFRDNPELLTYLKENING